MKILFIFLILLSGTANAEKDIKMLKIYEQFTLASAAAGKCIKPKKELLTSFLANYQMVHIRALQQIKKLKPKITNKQAANILKKGGMQATNAVFKAIKEEGCESKKIKDLIKRFHMQANWKP